MTAHPTPLVKALLVAVLACSLSACGLVELPELPVFRPTRSPDPVAGVAQRFPADPDLPTRAPTRVDAFLTAGTRTVAAGRVDSEVPRPVFGYSDDAGATWKSGELSAAAHNASVAGELPTGLAAVRPGAKPLWLQLGVEAETVLAWTSKDGATWERIPAAGLRLKAVTFTSLTATPQGFVLLGAKLPAGSAAVPTAWRSSDGANWSETPMGAPGEPQAVAVRGDLLVAVGTDRPAQRDSQGRACTALAYASADGGRTWQSRELPTPPGGSDFCSQATAVTVTATGIVAGGSSYDDAGQTYRPAVWTSPDGGDWASGKAPEGGDRITSLANWNGSVLAAVRTRAQGQWASSLARFDGAGWLTVTAPLKGAYLANRVDAGPEGFLVSTIDLTGPLDRGEVWRSADGLGFQPVGPSAEPPAAGTRPEALVVGPDKVRRAFGMTQNSAAMWVVDPGGAGSLPATLVAGRQYDVDHAAAGPPGTLVWGTELVEGAAQAVAWFSPDGSAFKRIPDANLRIAGPYGFTEIRDIVWAADRWVAVGSESSNGSVRRSALAYTSTNGTDWRKGTPAATYATGDAYSASDELTDLAGLDGRARTMEAVTAVGDSLVAVGWVTDGAVTKGAVWTAPGKQVWRLAQLPAPDGATDWAATRVASVGRIVVASGWSTTKDSDQERYHLWTSADGGATWAVSKTGDSATELGFRPVASGQRIVAVQESKDGSQVKAWTSGDGVGWQPGLVDVPQLTGRVRATVASVTVEDGHLLLLVKLTGATASRTVVVTYPPP